ncbi:ATPase [Yokenella regensburgei]|uniref:ATPase n=1 Tax=Yokenella regensburgei TaxID=158877 RepID=UPI0014333C9A|nr:ATPase [Yokenella regensburgei]QIU89835.1 ATPase [Yokenella regensburgei]
MSKQESSVAQTTLSKENNHVLDVYHASSTVYFRPETEEFILLADDACDDFDKHWGELIKCVDEFHQASGEYSTAVEEYGTIFSTPAESASEAPLEEKATKLQSTLDDKKQALQDKLGEFTPQGYQPLVELIPVVTKKKNGRRSGPGSRYIYVKKGYFDELGAGKKHIVSLKAKDKASATESIFIYDKNGNRKGIDTKKLKSQLTNVEFPKPDTSIELFSIDKDDIGEIDKTLTAWADSWNNSLSANNLHTSKHIDISAGAQFMRFTANAGASSSWDAKDGKFTIKGEASAALSIAQGSAGVEYFLPDRVGWPLTYHPEGAMPLDMGMLRVRLKTELIGFVGASTQIESQLQVVTVGADQLLMGKRDKKNTLPRFNARRATGKEFHSQMDSGDEGVTSSMAAFGGAKVELSLEGGVQWLQPVAATVYQGKTGDEAKAAAKFVDFCTIGTSIAGMAGIGAGATFYCTFVNGKFCFKVAASLCCGAGAKGAFLCEVGYKKITDFGAWLAYQLYGLDYHFFELVAKEAFKAYSQIVVMLLSDMRESLLVVLDKFGTVPDTISDMFSDFQTEMIHGLKSSTRRNTLANKINSELGELLTYTPEAKGNLLYLLTRHGVWDHIDINNRGDGIIPDIYFDRKIAIINILSSIQTQREWIKVMTHCSRDGENLALSNPMSEAALVLWQESELRAFLQEGLNRDDELDKIKARIRREVAWGYALAMNNTYDYQLARGDNPLYPRMGEFGPLGNNQALV